MVLCKHLDSHCVAESWRKYRGYTESILRLYREYTEGYTEGIQRALRKGDLH